MKTPAKLETCQTTEYPAEYILVADTTSIILKSSKFCGELIQLATTIREAGGQVTIFKSIEF